MRYKTLAKLVEAYKSGEISKDDPLWLDNDTASVYVGEDSERVFSMHPGVILEQSLDLLGIPHEGV